MPSPSLIIAILIAAIVIAVAILSRAFLRRYDNDNVDVTTLTLMIAGPGFWIAALGGAAWLGFAT